jgi:2-oxoglutarate dehydrogenase E1 component
MSSSDLAHGMNAEFLETLYDQYQKHPDQLHSSWQHYFKALETDPLISAQQMLFSPRQTKEDIRLHRLIEAYRMNGHLFAKINPIALHPIEQPTLLKEETWGFTTEELSQPFLTCGCLPQETAPLKEIIEHLQVLYSGRIGIEYKGLQRPDLENWIQQKVESGYFQQELLKDQKMSIFDHLNRAELFESFLHTKYVGQKRFSIEGGETLIPMLAFLVEEGAEKGIEEIVLGMAHRGRLNVMSHLLNKSYKEALSEFNEHYIPESFEGTGDVKYHRGFTSSGLKTNKGKKIQVILTPNPSHLESVDPVVEGETRAKQFLVGDEERSRVIPVLVHGDAALSGQGIVYETLQLSQLPGYTTGGTLHFVVNNQIGFTTISRDMRSTRYCTDLARAFSIPVLHVNAEDPETCILATLFALEIRQVFHCDIMIDLNCYRKYGHNETDEPAFTQPLEYQFIKRKQSIRELYRDQLIEQHLIDLKRSEEEEQRFKQNLQDIYAVAKESVAHPIKNLMTAPSDQIKFDPFPTGVSNDMLLQVTERFSAVPEGFELHPKLKHLVQQRLKMVKEGKPMDWGMAEYLAYATLLWEGISIRLTGQDTLRGTFSHRHAVWMDQKVEREYFPLQHLKEGQGTFCPFNSPLSELAVMAFEYGYSLVCRKDLTIWEAQFGDFSNGAQVIIDQYLTSGEQKWGQQSGLTLLLPHGYEGQGPEHSSGRLERFLSLAGHDNIQVVHPTTPAQFFHLLRRQVLRPLRKPLIVFTPKGLLRHPACTSLIQEFEEGFFQDVLDDPIHPSFPQQLVLCTGRVYYDLIAERERRTHAHVAIIRIEQLYPLNKERLKQFIQSYHSMQECLWVQEEPQNMGAWSFIRSYLDEMLPKGVPLYYVGRPISGSPATGSHTQHEKEYTNILNQVFNR